MRREQRQARRDATFAMAATLSTAYPGSWRFVIYLAAEPITTMTAARSASAAPVVKAADGETVW